MTVGDEIEPNIPIAVTQISSRSRPCHDHDKIRHDHDSQGRQSRILKGIRFNLALKLFTKVQFGPK